MPRAIVLGAGTVGSVMAADLASDPTFDVAVADNRVEALEWAKTRAGDRLTTMNADLSNSGVVKDVVEPFDIVLGAISSRIGLQTLRAVIESGKNYCDVTFMAENALELDSLAKQHGVTAVVDCGLAPGVSHMIAARESATMDECSRIEIFVGGLPREPRWPFRYKAPFSPHDVLEEYTRPARSVENGRVVVREALSEPEMIDFPEVGTLEAFNTDGLRSLIITLKVPFMKEKTLRYPGHIELMRVLRAMGLFSHEPIEIAGRRVRPIDVTSRLLFPLWTFAEGEEDVTVMRVIVSGEKSGRKERHIWELLDYYDTNTQTTSMARTTAFACTAVARLIASGKFQRPGVIGPEIIGLDAGIFEHVIREQASRGVDYTRRVETLA